ncbi:MAG TPA: hypothetical protein VHL34_17250 [Rhizomicrobium sp.]|jgi:hypothetical protein|nr:hypothetical protein [Rhizomicrobium sp.]
MTTASATTVSTAKKRVRKAKAAVKKAMPLETTAKTAKKAVKIGAIGAGAMMAGKAAFSALRYVVGSVIVVGAAVAAASLIPKPMQRQLIGNARSVALLARDKALEGAKSLAA